MKTRALGQTGIQVPEIGQGTWQFESANRAESIKALHRGMELGMTHIDTAELYGRGSVEELLGEALQGRRDKAFLASKVKPINASRQGTVEACEASLARLKTDHLDLYLLHWPGDIPVAETLEAFETLKAQGKIRHYGVSNFDARQLRRTVEIAGPGKVACNQVLYHLRDRGMERELHKTALELGVSLVAFSPFGQGNFPGPPSPGGKLLKEIGARHKVGPRPVALRFLLRLEGVLAIPKAAQVAHVEDNALARDLVLAPDEIAALEDLFTR